jgi:hypothetical protein
MERAFRETQDDVELPAAAIALRIVGSLLAESSLPADLSGLVAPVFLLAFPLSVWVSHSLAATARIAWKNVTGPTALLLLPSLVQAIAVPEYYGWAPSSAADALRSSVAPRVMALHARAPGSLATALHRCLLVGVSCFQFEKVTNVYVLVFCSPILLFHGHQRKLHGCHHCNRSKTYLPIRPCGLCASFPLPFVAQLRQSCKI